MGDSAGARVSICGGRLDVDRAATCHFSVAGVGSPCGIKRVEIAIGAARGRAEV